MNIMPLPDGRWFDAEKAECWVDERSPARDGLGGMVYRLWRTKKGEFISEEFQHSGIINQQHQAFAADLDNAAVLAWLVAHCIPVNDAPEQFRERMTSLEA